MSRLALTCAALVTTAVQGRVFSSKFNGASSPQYVAKFAFGIDQTGAPVGYAHVVVASPMSQSQLAFLSYDDDAWGGVYSNSGFTASCPGKTLYVCEASGAMIFGAAHLSITTG